MESEHEPGQLEELFGSRSATARILDFLSVFRDYDYNKQDIAKNSDVSPRHAATAINKLEKLEMIKRTRTVGISQMYKFNSENPAAMLLAQFVHELASQECTKLSYQEQTKPNMHSYA